MTIPEVAALWEIVPGTAFQTTAAVPPIRPWLRRRMCCLRPAICRRAARRSRGAYVVSGIGFLGAGVILKEGTQIRGLKTAATLWCPAAVGAFAGAALWTEAIALSFFVVAGNTLLRPLANYINRLPIDTHTAEARCRVHVVTDRRKVSDARDMLDETLEKVGYPILEFDTLSETEAEVELAAVLVPTSADPVVLDAVVAQLEKSPAVYSATWPVSTTP